MCTELGLRKVAFEVGDLDTILDRLAADGYRLVGGVGQYEQMWRDAASATRSGRMPARPFDTAPDPSSSAEPMPGAVGAAERQSAPGAQEEAVR